MAHSCKSVIWHSSGLLFAFFLTELCRLTAQAMGWVIAISLFVNALADLAMSARWNRYRDRPRALGRLQARGAWFAGLFLVAFSAIPFLPLSARLPMAVATLVAFRLSFAMLDVPQNAMIPILATGPAQRASLLAARNICAGLSGLIVVLVAAPIVLSGAEGSVRHLWWAVALGSSAALSAWWLTRSIRLGLPDRTDGAAESSGRVFPALLLLPLAGVLVAANTMFRSLEPYAAAYAGFGLGILIWASIGTIACQPFWVVACRRLSRASAAALAGCLVLAGAAALAGASRWNPLSLSIAGLGFGVGVGGLWLMLWAIVTQHDAVRGTRRLTAVSKTAQGVAALWLGHVLHGTSYRFTMVDAASPPRVMMVGALVAAAACGFALAIGEWRISRTASDAGPATPHPAVPPVRGPAARPRAA